MRDTVLRTTRAAKDRNQRLTVSQSSMLVTYWKRIWLRTMERRIQMLLKARKSTKFRAIELILEGQNWRFQQLIKPLIIKLMQQNKEKKGRLRNLNRNPPPSRSIWKSNRSRDAISAATSSWWPLYRSHACSISTYWPIWQTCLSRSTSQELWHAPVSL